MIEEILRGIFQALLYSLAEAWFKSTPGFCILIVLVIALALVGRYVPKRASRRSGTHSRR